MAIFARLRLATRAALGQFFHPASESNSWSTWLAGRSTSGETVTPDTARRIATVYACTRVLSESIGYLPLNVYRRLPNNGREIAYDHPLSRLLHGDRTNPYQTPFEFKELLQSRLTLRGNAYARILFNGRGEIESLLPLHPDRVQVLVNSQGELFYQHTPPSGAKIYRSDEILHLRALGDDGIIGRSPIDECAEVMGEALAMGRFSSETWQRGARFSGALTYPGTLSPAAQESIRKSWESTYSGTANSGKVLILERGFDYKPLSMTVEQAQFIEKYKLTRSEIAGIFRVPPHLIGDLERATFSNIEHMSLEFIQFTMGPWIVRWENALQAALFSPEEQEQYFVKFNTSAFLRGDALARAQKLAIERTNGIISANEWRALEELNPIDPAIGDVYLTPLNMSVNGNQQQTPATGGVPTANGAPAPAGAGSAPNIARDILTPLVHDIARRLSTKELKARKADDKWPETFIDAQSNNLRETFEPLILQAKKLGYAPEDLQRIITNKYRESFISEIKSVTTSSERAKQIESLLSKILFEGCNS